MSEKGHWNFLSNHAHALICIARDPHIRIRDLANNVGVTERAAASLIADLHEHGYISIEKVGRRNHYRIHRNKHLRHPLEAHHTVGQLLKGLGRGALLTKSRLAS